MRRNSANSAFSSARRTPRAAVLLLALCALLTGLTPSQPTKAASDADADTLVVAMPRTVARLDHLYGGRRQNVIVSLLADDGLMYVDPETLDYVPLAAESVRYVDDRTVDFTLRPGLRFHDGSPLTADDVVYTFAWLLEPAARVRRHKSVVRWLRSVDKTGPLSVRMRLRVPYPMLMRDLAISYPIRKAGTYGSLAEPARNRRAQYLTLNGLGPYRVVEFEKNGRVVFERHDGYPTDGPKGRAAIRRIVIEPIQDARDRVLAVERGTAHLATGIPAGLAEPAAADRGLSVLSGPDMRIGFLVMDAVGRTEADNPFTKLRVRRAVNHAIDRETLVRDLVKGGSRPIDAACHPRQFGCPDEVTRYAYDPAMARRLLAEAGYPDGFDVTLWAYREPAVADALVADLNAVGIRATLNYVDWRRTLQARRQGLIQLSFSTWGSGGTADAHAIASFFWPLDAERNFAHDPVVAVHIDRAGSVLVPDDRRLAYERAFTRIADQAYWAPLFTYTNTFVASPELFYPMAEDGVLRLFQASWQ